MERHVQMAPREEHPKGIHSLSEMPIKSTPRCLATCLARKVLPVPVGPTMSVLVRGAMGRLCREIPKQAEPTSRSE